MGWNAFSSSNYLFMAQGFPNQAHGLAFKQASDFVIEKTGAVDSGLIYGGLHNTAAANYLLEWVAGLQIQHVKQTRLKWTTSTVVLLNATTDWDLLYLGDKDFAFWSAKKFLEVCANHWLSITFNFYTIHHVGL